MVGPLKKYFFCGLIYDINALMTFRIKSVCFLAIARARRFVKTQCFSILEQLCCVADMIISIIAATAVG